ncbi:MAG TPA: flagellar hook capping FlgD N-terminal domain-containing protein [Acidobacteriota bacterium]|nr:flagellar hook capping FlgD N-terminal domain-containing protein [Acidobacteriota bacterium]
MSTVNGVGTTYADQNTANTPSNITSSATDVSKTEFLNLLVAQLQNQDPMNPVDNQQFLGQLATFSSLEQLVSINTAVTKLAGIVE